MATTVGNLVANLELRAGQFISEQKRVTRSVKRLESGFGTLKRVAAAALSIETVRIAARYADEYNQLSTRIKTATRETGDFVKVQQQLAGIAIQTGASFETTIDTFQALSRVRDDLGATNAQFVELTRIVNQLGVIGGASTTAISNGLRQFNQGLAAGIFRAEEFNSIVENLPELAFRIARGLGKTQGQLRQMVIDGQLLSRDVFKVLIEQSGDISSQFQKIPNNLDRAFNALTTAIGGALSKVDEAVGATGALAGALQNVADELAILSGNATPLQALEEQARDITDQMELLARSGDAFTSGALFENYQQKMLALSGRLDEVLKKMAELRQESEVTPDLTPIAQGRAAPSISPTVTSREIAPISSVVDASNVMTTATDAMVEEYADMLTEMEQRHENFTTLFTDNMVQAADSGFDSILRSWARTLQQMVARALGSQLFNLFGFGNEGGGFLGLGTLFGGTRASGGSVSGGKAYLVGERGPEMFMPGQSGQIIPNGAGGDINITQNIVQPGASPDEISRKVISEIQDMRRRGR